MHGCVALLAPANSVRILIPAIIHQAHLKHVNVVLPPVDFSMLNPCLHNAGHLGEWDSFPVGSNIFTSHDSFLPFVPSRQFHMQQLVRLIQVIACVLLQPLTRALAPSDSSDSCAHTLCCWYTVDETGLTSAKAETPAPPELRAPVPLRVPGSRSRDCECSRVHCGTERNVSPC